MKVIFYNSKLEKEFFKLDKLLFAKSLKTINLLKKYGNQLGMPHSKKLAFNLYELRIQGNPAFRLLYCYKNKQAVIIHQFTKKTQRTPKKEIELALKRVDQI